MQVTLLIVADPELRTDLTRPVLGTGLLGRNIDRARRAGYERIAALPGIRSESQGLAMASVGERLPGPVLIVLEGSSVSLSLFSLIRRTLLHPSWRGEGRTIYDAAGRPALYLGAELTRVPARMPIAQGAELPEPWRIDSANREQALWRAPGGEGDELVRVVQDSDWCRVEAQLLREVGLEPQRVWHAWLSVPLLRLLSLKGGTLAQWELFAVLAGIISGVLVAIDQWWSLVLGSLFALVAVECTLLLPHWISLTLQSEESEEGIQRSEGLMGPGVGVARAVRPLTHAGLLLALGYAWVRDGDARLRFLHLSVAELTVLCVSAAGAILLLAHGRARLRGGGWGHDLALARFDRFLGRVGIAAPWGRDEFALLELIMSALALAGYPLLLWWLLVVASVSRLWRWALRPVSGDTSEKTEGP